MLYITSGGKLSVLDGGHAKRLRYGCKDYRLLLAQCDSLGEERPLMCFTGKKNTSCLQFLIRKHDWSPGPGRTMLTCRDQRSDQTLGWMTEQ